MGFTVRKNYREIAVLEAGRAGRTVLSCAWGSSINNCCQVLDVGNFSECPGLELDAKLVDSVIVPMTEDLRESVKGGGIATVPSNFKAWIKGFERSKDWTLLRKYPAVDGSGGEIHIYWMNGNDDPSEYDDESDEDYDY